MRGRVPAPRHGSLDIAQSGHQREHGGSSESFWFPTSERRSGRQRNMGLGLLCYCLREHHITTRGRDGPDLTRLEYRTSRTYTSSSGGAEVNDRNCGEGGSSQLQVATPSPP